MVRRPRLPGILGAVASAMGLFFAAFSTHDYATHLDRQLHGTHCSFLPGIGGVEKGENACKAAMYSPFSALFRDRMWGGVPISLFALGVYGVFFGLSLYLLLARDTASKRTWQGFGVAALTPLPVTILMLVISATQLGEFCKLCVGLYVSSLLLGAAGIIALMRAGGKNVSAPTRPPAEDTSPTMVDSELPYFLQDKKGKSATTKPAPTVADRPVPVGSFLVIPAFLLAVGVAAVLPAAVYAGALPSYKSYVLACGTIKETTESHGAFVKIPTSQPKAPALIFEDPLCPTCRAFHQRLVTEGVYERLDLTVAIFPLDECNFLLENRSLHPGACVVAKAFLCADKSGKARQVLEWSYENQEDLIKAGKAGKDEIRQKVVARFPEVDKCLDAKETQQRLDQISQFAVKNELHVMTPQLFLGDKRVCDEDTDLGLTYALKQLAPKVMQ